MLLTITANLDQDATDLGYLLHKHPDRVQQFSLSFGTARVFYPVANDTRCTAALLLEIDPVALTRGSAQRAGHQLWPYVNDRPYVASSFLSVAISRVFGTALSGNCSPREGLAKQAIPLEFDIAAIPCRGGERFLQELFSPLGYEVVATHLASEEESRWGTTPLFRVTLKSDSYTLSEALSHLYVLIPVLDDDKHYFIGKDEVDKLLRHGEGWLAAHPARDAITRRYLERRGRLVRDALGRLEEEEQEHATANSETAPLPVTQEEEDAPIKRSLHAERIETVYRWILATGARRVLDLGCGEGKLMEPLVKTSALDHVAGVDVCSRALEICARRLKLDRLSPTRRAQISLWQGSLTYRDPRLESFDAAALVEVIEHIEPERLPAMERALFEFASPHTVIITTPNRDHNVLFETLPANTMRHKDHRFEWSRAEFADWIAHIEQAFGYSASVEAIGEDHPEHGPPCQAVIFTRDATTPIPTEVNR